MGVTLSSYIMVDRLRLLSFWSFKSLECEETASTYLECKGHSLAVQRSFTTDSPVKPTHTTLGFGDKQSLVVTILGQYNSHAVGCYAEVA